MYQFLCPVPESPLPLSRHANVYVCVAGFALTTRKKIGSIANALVALMMKMMPHSNSKLLFIYDIPQLCVAFEIQVRLYTLCFRSYSLVTYSVMRMMPFLRSCLIMITAAVQ